MAAFPRLTLTPTGRRASGGVLAWFVGLAGAMATFAALAVGAVLALFTAAAVAVIALAAGVVMLLSGLALGARRRAAPARSAEGVIEARKVGQTWVAYGWERPGR